ncbi:MAG: hypothetical protein J2P32_07065 [Actinobacteria bacterium]|nr:hypothetical protein [Actinomycetota bacterium]
MDRTENVAGGVPRRRRSWKKILIIALAAAVSWGVKIAVFGGVGYALFSALFH